MDLKLLEESVRGFKAPDYGKVQRSGESYAATERWAKRILKISLGVYKRIGRLDQTARLMRDLMESVVRRYHEYFFDFRKQTHYRDSTSMPGETKGLVVEHVIPVRFLIAGLVQGKLPIELVLNPPICLIRKIDDVVLEDSGFGDITPDVWWFWKRYQVLDNITLITNRNDVVDPATWNLGTHCDYFKVFD